VIYLAHFVLDEGSKFLGRKPELDCEAVLINASAHDLAAVLRYDGDAAILVGDIG